MTKQKEVLICSAKRTAIGSFNGSLKSVSAVELGIAATKGAIRSAGVDASTVDEVIMGCVLSSGLGQAPARQVALGASLDSRVQAMTINKVCSSGLKAVMLAANEILLGHAHCVVAGGMENMSRAPYLLPAMRSGARLGHAEANDSILTDALWDVYNDFHMGNCAELCAKEFGFSREAQDEFALESYRRANKAIEEGRFVSEIVSVEVASRKSTVVFEIDEEPSKSDPSKISKLRPVFEKNGTVTAANASSINDGASALILCSEEYSKIHSLTPIAKLRTTAWFAGAPERFTTAPVGAVKNALDSLSLTVEDIDLFELNEAFSVVALACGGQLNIPSQKLNINGGAVSLGHPVGASGARILTTLLHALAAEKKQLGVAGICNGGGEATSVVVEML